MNIKFDGVRIPVGKVGDESIDVAMKSVAICGATRSGKTSVIKDILTVWLYYSSSTNSEFKVISCKQGWRSLVGDNYIPVNDANSFYDELMNIFLSFKQRSGRKLIIIDDIDAITSDLKGFNQFQRGQLSMFLRTAADDNIMIVVASSTFDTDLWKDVSIDKVVTRIYTSKLSGSWVPPCNRFKEFTGEIIKGDETVRSVAVYETIEGDVSFEWSCDKVIPTHVTDDQLRGRYYCWLNPIGADTAV